MIRRFLLRYLVLAVLFLDFALLLPVPALAGSPPVVPTAATCATLVGLLTVAKPGAILVLSGTCSTITISGRTFSPPVTIDASAAIVQFSINAVDGLNIVGGQSLGTTGAHETGIGLGNSRNVSVDGYRCTNMRLCVSFGNVSDFVISNIVVNEPQSDGVDVALSRRGIVQNVRCAGGVPLPGAHADCIQLWSKATNPPSADIVVRNNSSTGQLRMFGAFDHGVDGGYDRLTITGNVGITNDAMAIGVNNCRLCIIQGNTVRLLWDAAHYGQINTAGSTPAFVGAIGGNAGGPMPTALVRGASAAATVAAALALRPVASPL